MKRRIGFVGCYSQDVILLLTKVLSCLERRVLIRDRNRQRTLLASVPVPEGVSVTNTMAEYDGFLFTEQEIRQSSEEECDVEMIDFGMEVPKEEAGLCSELVIVTDMLPHHIGRLEEAELSRESVRVCILRDAFEDSCKGEAEVAGFLRLFPNRSEYFLPPDFRDVRNRYVCEARHEYNINKASPEMQAMIYRMAGELCPEYTEREVRRRVKYQERRRYR